MGETNVKNDGINRAKLYQLVLFPLNNGATNVYYVLVLAYIATFGSNVLGLGVLFASVMVTGMRVFDAFTDPIIGALMDRTNGRFGKFRPFMVIGNLIMALSIITMYIITPRISGFHDGFQICSFCWTLCHLGYRLYIPDILHKSGADGSYLGSEAETSFYHF